MVSTMANTGYSVLEAANGISQADNGTKLKYQGRKTSRTNSEQRRRTILEAALKIVVRDGIRGVRHRAVAKEAEVPLSATTYYFKDISDLITDTFTLFVEVGAETFKTYWEKSETQLQVAVHALNQSQISRKQFAQHLSELAVEYVLVQLREHRNDLIAERAFKLECLRNENLRPIAFNHQAYFLKSLEAFFKTIGSEEAEVDARLFAAVLRQVEFEGLISNNIDNSTDMIRKILRRQIMLMVSTVK